MSQIRIFDDVLTTNEVSDIYTEPAASNNTLNYPAGAGCIAAYPLGENANDIPSAQSATSIATYQLNSDVTSIPSNTYPGTATSVSYAAGKFGNAAVFDGSSSDIIISGLSSMFSTKATFTVSLWFKTTATGNRACLLYTSPSPRDKRQSRMPSSA